MRFPPALSTRAMLLIFLAAAAPTTLQAQPAVASATTAPAHIPFIKADAEAVVAELAGQLEDNFVFPDVAKKYAAMLRANLAAGKYSTLPDAGSFARAVTADLQAVHKDGHLALRAPRPAGGERRRSVADFGDASGIAKSGWIADGVAYVSFTLFPGNQATLDGLRAFLDRHKGAKTLIIDAREHRGGGMPEMGLMFPYLFAEPTILVGMETRAAAAAGEQPEPGEEAYVRTVAGPKEIIRREHFVAPASDTGGLQRARVYLLTSKRTASAAEHLSLALKRTHRATLIGEATYGAGHYGSFVGLGHGFAAMIPVGRSFDPDTGQSWEGVGVKPDIAVPADKALDEALKLAGVAETGQVALAKLR